MTDTTAYRVLARKYRPETFVDLVGQDAMVRTLKNAFEADRIAHTFTHGTSEQRSRWFRTGFDSGRVAECDTFAATQL